MKYTLILLITLASFAPGLAMEEEQIKQHPFIDYNDPDGRSCYQSTHYGCLSIKRFFRNNAMVRHEPTENSSVSPVAPVELTVSESLWYAVLQNNPELVLKRINTGADVNMRSSNGWTPLHFAARDRNGTIARILLASPAIDAYVKTPDGKTPLDILQERQLAVIYNTETVRINPVTKQPYPSTKTLEVFEKRTRYIMKLYSLMNDHNYPFAIQGTTLIWQKDGKEVI